MNPTFYPLIFLWIVIFIMIPAQNKRRKRRRNLYNKERIHHMNELIMKMIGKRCEISGDLYVGAVGTITDVQDGWLEYETDKGQKNLVNITYISRIRELPEKKK